jgi:hypothetical protein
VVIVMSSVGASCRPWRSITAAFGDEEDVDVEPTELVVEPAESVRTIRGGEAALSLSADAAPLSE